jgi:hypothetical protein
MAEDSTRKLLKVFGVAMTDFEDAGARLRERAETAAPQDLLALAGETIAASAEMNRRWLDVTRFLFEEQARLHAEVGQCIAAARGDRP